MCEREGGRERVAERRKDAQQTSFLLFFFRHMCVRFIQTFSPMLNVVFLSFVAVWIRSKKQKYGCLSNNLWIPLVETVIDWCVDIKNLSVNVVRSNGAVAECNMNENVNDHCSASAMSVLCTISLDMFSLHA